MKHLDPLVDHNNFDKSIKNHAVNMIIRKLQTHSDLSQYLHTSCLSPTASTFTAAIKNNNFTS